MGSTVPASVRAVGRAHSRPSVGRPAGPGVGISLRRELGNPMVTSGAPLYRDGMTSAELTTRRVPAVVRALWAAPTRRATGNALAALLVAAVGAALLGGLVIITAGAVYSLVHWPVGGWAHAVLYLAEVLAAPVLVLWVIQGLAALQRARLHATLGLELPAGGRAAQRKPWPVGPWRDAATWRQLGYHLLAVLIGGAGGGLVVACWLAPVGAIGYLAAGHTAAVSGAAAVLAAAALLLAAPWLARLVARADEAAARALLGPSRNEALALRVESLARSRSDILAATDAPRDAQQAIADAHDEAMLALSDLRDFIRGLHPAVLSDRGLAAALSGLAARAPLPVRLRIDTPRPASASIEAVAYFIVSEALA